MIVPRRIAFSIAIVTAVCSPNVSIAQAVDGKLSLADQERVSRLAATFTRSVLGFKKNSDGRLLATITLCCNASGCYGPFPSNIDCGPSLKVSCETTIDVNGAEFPIPPLCTPQP